MSTRRDAQETGASEHGGFGSAAFVPLPGGATARAGAAREVWASALCAQVDPDLFFPEKGQPSAPAKAVCARCPVTALCLETFGPLVDQGVVGGLTAQERRARRKAGSGQPGEVAA
jgi:WhiB family transcriptional regulator, redox-sensing transcriptional regulator